MKIVTVGGVAGRASCAARLRRLDEKGVRETSPLHVAAGMFSPK